MHILFVEFNPLTLYIMLNKVFKRACMFMLCANSIIALCFCYKYLRALLTHAKCIIDAYEYKI